jgi:CHASE2 domain-containing sensor protein
VLSSYFGKLILSGWKLARVDENSSTKYATDSTLAGQVSEAFDYPQVSDIYRLGDELHLPLPELLHAAGGIGHVNVEEDRTLSLFIANENLIIPSFGIEVLRVYCDAKRDNLRYDHETLALRREGKLLEFRTEDGKVNLNYAGRISAFTIYHFLVILRSYDELRTGRTPTIPVQNLKDKIILIGVIAEGRSETFTMPVDPRFPALGLHAVFLDNALRSGFLQTTPTWLVYVLCLLLGFACAAPLLCR